MNRVQKFFSRVPLYLRHYLYRVDEHSLQGPFAFDFVMHVVKGKTGADFSAIEGRRAELKKSKKEVEYVTFGNTSQLSPGKRKKVAGIASRGISSRQKSQLFYRIIRAYNCHSVFELGTSLGINTCYLAKAATAGTVVTFEGHPALASLAKETFNCLGINNVKLIAENIDDVLERQVNAEEKIDFVFIDANHRSEALNKYAGILSKKMHEESVMVVDDIRWSRDMYEGWKKICENNKISHVFDFCDFGVLFFRNTHKLQHFLLHL